MAAVIVGAASLPSSRLRLPVEFPSTARRTLVAPRRLQRVDGSIGDRGSARDSRKRQRRGPTTTLDHGIGDVRPLDPAGFMRKLVQKPVRRGQARGCHTAGAPLTVIARRSSRTSTHRGLSDRDQPVQTRHGRGRRADRSRQSGANKRPSAAALPYPEFEPNGTFGCDPAQRGVGDASQSRPREEGDFG